MRYLWHSTHLICDYAYIRNRHSKYNVCKRDSTIILNMEKKEFAVPTLLCWDQFQKSLPSNREVSSWLASQLLAIMMARNVLSSTWFIFPVVFTTQLQRWRESSNKCTDSVNVRVHQAKWMVPSAKWSSTAFCHHSPPIRPSLDPFLLHIFSAEYKLPGNILYFKVLAYHMFFLQAISVCFLVDCQFIKQFFAWYCWWHLPFYFLESCDKDGVIVWADAIVSIGY